MNRPIADPSDLGAALRTARRAQHLTQRQVAELSGVSVRLWNETERGKRAQLGLETAIRMLQTLGLDLLVRSRRTEATADTGADARVDRGTP